MQLQITGAVVEIDEEDYSKVKDYAWHVLEVDGLRYAVSSQHKRKHVYMHRLLMDAQVGEKVDHRDRDGLNNRRSNLRKCTNLQNQFNRGSNRRSTSKYKGVSWSSSRKRWVAQIVLHGKRKYLGEFLSEEFAAGVYDKAAREMFGEFAFQNFPNYPQS